MKTPSPTIATENQAAAAAFGATAHLPRGTAAVAARAVRGGELPWMLLFIIVGLVTVAACVLVPLREENRQLAHALENLRVEAAFVQRQVEANGEFLKRVHEDPVLAERLVMRITRKPAAGKKFLEPGEIGEPFGSSPYAITQIAPPPPPAQYRTDLPPVLGSLVLDARSRVVLIGAGLFLMAAAVILGRPRGEPCGS